MTDNGAGVEGHGDGREAEAEEAGQGEAGGELGCWGWPGAHQLQDLLIRLQGAIVVRVARVYWDSCNKHRATSSVEGRYVTLEGASGSVKFLINRHSCSIEKRAVQFNL